MLTTLPISLLLPLAVATSGAAGDPKAPEAETIEVYDLSPALHGTLDGGMRETLLPFLSPSFHKGEESFEAMDGADTLIDLLRSLCGDEFDYEGREIVLDGDAQRLIVRAPAALQAKTKAFLGFLEDVLGASLELRVDAVQLSGPEAGTPVPALLPMAEVDRLLARAEGGAPRTYRLRVRAGGAASLDLTRSAPMVVDYDVEIAQASAIADPIVEEVPVGTRLQARAAPAPGGTWLSLILRRGDPLSDVEDRELSVPARVTTQDRVDYVTVTNVFQSVEVLNRSFALDVFLPEGRALAIQSTVLVGGRPRSEVLLVRRASGSLPSFRRLALGAGGGGAGGELVFLNAESASPPRSGIEARAMPAAGLPASWNLMRTSDAGRVVGVTSGFEPGVLDLVQDLLGASAEDLEIRDFGPWLFLSNGSGSGGNPLDALFGGQGSAGFRLLEQLTPPARVVQVALVLRRGGGPPIATCSLPVRAGRTAVAVLGTERIEVDDWDVEVAQGASIADAVMRNAFDGLAVEVRPAFSRSGDLALSLVARAHVRRGDRRELDLGVRGLGPIDESTYDQAFLRETLVFGDGEGKARRHVLGDASGSASSDALSLEVEATELK